jgi:Protein of unknown function (DUF4089)
MKHRQARKSRRATTKATGKSRSKPRSKSPSEPRSKPPARIASSRTDSIGTLVEACAQALAIRLDPAWRAGIAFNIALILRHGKLVDEFALPDAIEPAPVFYA